MSAALLDVIEARGLVPMHDARVLSATTILAGGPVDGSWWSHPKANEMYRAMNEVEDHEDVALVKLLGAKLTFVHRRLWAPLFAAVTERAEWQTAGLARSTERLVERIEQAKQVRGDELRDLKKETKLIEERLLAFVSSVHTDSGRHEKVFESWPAWRARVGLTGRKPAAGQARATLEGAAADFAPLRLPWAKKRAK